MPIGGADKADVAGGVVQRAGLVADQRLAGQGGVHPQFAGDAAAHRAQQHLAAGWAEPLALIQPGKQRNHRLRGGAVADIDGGGGVDLAVVADQRADVAIDPHARHANLAQPVVHRAGAAYGCQQRVGGVVVAAGEGEFDQARGGQHLAGAFGRAGAGKPRRGQRDHQRIAGGKAEPALVDHIEIGGDDGDFAGAGQREGLGAQNRDAAPGGKIGGGEANAAAVRLCQRGEFGAEPCLITHRSGVEGGGIGGRVFMGWRLMRGARAQNRIKGLVQIVGASSLRRLHSHQQRAQPHADCQISC